jgi:hypothetical protein
MGVVTFTATADPLPLELAEVRDRAVARCAAMILLSGLACYMAGRTSHRWRSRL